MDDIERDGAIAIDVAFGNITFCRDEGGTFVQAVADMSTESEPRDRIEIVVRVAASHNESIIDIVDKSRLHIIRLMKAGVDRLDAETAETLLYQTERTQRI